MSAASETDVEEVAGRDAFDCFDTIIIVIIAGADSHVVIERR